MIKHAVIPAAGFGTRFLPATKAQPKEMLPIIDKPTIQFVIEEAVNSGIRDILIITGRGKRSIEDHFDKSYELEEYLKKKGETRLLEEIEKISSLASIHYVRQKEQRGLGDAVMCAKEHVRSEPFALLLGDTIVESKVPLTRQLTDKYSKYKGSIIAVEEVEEENIQKYGIVKGKKIASDTYEIESLVEKPAPSAAPSNLGIIGRYVLTPEIFDALKKAPEGKGGEIQLTDAMNLLCKNQRMYASTFEGERFDIGNRLDYAKAFLKMGIARKDIGSELEEYAKKLVK
ncbi:UTP--glucose-1-phosphate uridylyltransferase GalU [Candidatus Micrarchaeota archaeon]|nr:UTP--glucose-1-phosphate uridylyltransferase GalU [Candidatus Micrarchaeota archaeon]